MDTNLDKKPGRNPFSKLIAATWGTLLIILFLAVVSVGIYAPIKDYVFDSEVHIEQHIESSRFADTLADMTMYLLARSRVQLAPDGVDYFGFWHNRNYPNVQSIKYYITNRDQAFIISNMPEPTFAGRFYLTISFDEDGNPTVWRSSQSPRFNDAFIDGLSSRISRILRMEVSSHIPIAPVEATWETNPNHVRYQAYNEAFVEVEFENEIFAEIRTNTSTITEMSDTVNALTAFSGLEINYIIPSGDLFAMYSDFFTHEIKSLSISHHITLILKIGAASILLLTILTFAIPFSLQRKVPIISLFNEKLPLEFKVMAWFGFMLGSILIMRIIDNWWWLSPPPAHNYVNIIHDANSYFYLIGIPITFMLCLLIYLSICYVKYIYHEGPKEGLVKNSFIVKAFLFTLNGINELSRQIIEIDITQEYHKKFIIILAINLLAIWTLWAIISSLGVIGIILSIAYTIFLFKYFINVLDKVRSLNLATKRLAQGDFNVTIKEDLGILNPIANNLNNIKAGFKVAVEKEVKSQNLKNELITNVSHDLKTPLTSIITYVDLLKNEDSTPETQKEYIEILDRKSQRLKVLIEDLFEASKASSGNVELYPEDLDIVALLRQTLGELEEKINNSTLDIKVNAPETKIICRLDGQKTYRIFENIMSNILKFSMPNSRVYIDVLETEKEVSFIFKNISAYEMNFDTSEIVERFTRGDKARTTEGSGLGLAIAKSLVELQNGSMLITIDGDLFKLTVNFARSQQDEN